MSGRIAMSITSTRRVSTSLSYSQPVKGGYDVANKNQSFVETIDTANNVLVDDLVVTIYKSNADKELLGVDDTADFASLYYAKQTDYSIITNGQDSFVLNIGQNRSLASVVSNSLRPCEL